MPTPTYIALANLTLSSTDSVVEFASIPNTYRDLVVIVEGTTAASVNGSLYFNGQTSAGSNYSWVRMYGQGSGTGVSNKDATTAFAYDFYTNRTILRIQIMDYSATDKHKTILSRWDTAQNITGATAMRWANTNAITSLSFSPGTNFNLGTTFALYGIVS